MKLKKNDLKSIIKKSLKESIENRMSNFVYQRLLFSNRIENTKKFLFINGALQTYTLLNQGSIIKEGKVSTGARGFGNTAGSGKTSTGLMEVKGFFGRNLPDYTILRSLAPTNPIITLGPNTPSTSPGHVAEVLTRAITLKGLDSQNRNVRERNIYLHGTNRESLLGKPASGGCIRFSNEDIKDLSDNLLSTGDYVFVIKNYDQSIMNQINSDEGRSESSYIRNIKRSIEDYIFENIMSQEELPKIDGKIASFEDVENILSKYEIEAGA